ncbi:MAG: 4-amino-4-deoxy-L-arabinose-phosphoundecaprenol flippase subunit ArnE [bacterium]|nr:4-amino-4-deoxy-L-arabinose-phosphoundecaprenol flippase subunit ArnE [bacterium]
MSKTSANLIFLISIAATIIGQLLLKKATAAQRLTFDPSQLWATVLGLALNPYLLGWVLSAGVSAALWIFVVSRFELSLAFPIATTLSYILILVLSWWLFDEQMTVTRWIGVGLMSAGIFMTYQS